MSKILHRLYDLNSGGAEVVVLNMVRALPEHKHVIVFTNHSATWVASELERTNGVSLVDVECRDPRQVFSSESPDVLLFHYYPPMSREDLAELPLGIAERAAVYNHWYTEVPYLPPIQRYCFPAPSSTRTSGIEVPEQYRTTIINPVSECFFSVRRRDDATFRVGRHSRASSRKFSSDFFDLFEQIAIADLQVLALGHTAELAAWLSQRSSGLKHVYWLLPFNSMDVEKFLSFIDIYVYKTRDDFRETSPVCILESLASGIPVVAEAKGGIVDLVLNGETGYLCNTLEEYRSGVEALYTDPSLRSRYAGAAREWAREHASLRRFRQQVLTWLNLPAG